MPKLYEYMGIIVMFYANEHEPIHVHGKCQGRENKAELIIESGEIIEIRYQSVKGKSPLKNKEMKRFEAVVSHYADDIVQKWIQFFVLNLPIEAEIITQKL